MRCPPSSFEQIKEQIPNAPKVIKPHERIRTDNEIFINIEIDNFSTLKACLDNYFKTESLNNPDDYYQLNLNPNEITGRPNLVPYNEKKLPDCTRRLAISELNDIVIITLKRFEVIDQILGTTRKLEQDITVDQVINFGDYMANPALKNKSPNYNLIGAIVHLGKTLKSGHYIAYVKSDNQWYRCNDEVIESTTWAHIAQKDKKDGIYKSYAFFYQKEGTPSKIIAPQTQIKQEDLNLIQALTNLQVTLDGLHATLIH